MAGDSNDYENLAVEQRLKSAVHYTVGEICKTQEDADLRFSKQFIAVLSEATYKYAKTVSTDLEAFAKHAKRSTINVDDVKLLVRKSEALHSHITEMAEQLANESDKKTKSKKGRPKKKAATENVDEDDDSNM